LNFSKLDESSLKDPMISELRHKIYMTEDPSMTALGPRLKPARVKVTLTDGRQATAECENCKRDSQRTDPEPQVREKFRNSPGQYCRRRAFIRLNVPSTAARTGRAWMSCWFAPSPCPLISRVYSDVEAVASGHTMFVGDEADAITLREAWNY